MRTKEQLEKMDEAMSGPFLRGGLLALRAHAPDEHAKALHELALTVALHRITGGAPMRFTFAELKEAVLAIPEGFEDGFMFTLGSDYLEFSHAQRPRHPFEGLLAGLTEDGEVEAGEPS